MKRFGVMSLLSLALWAGVGGQEALAQRVIVFETPQEQQRWDELYERYAVPGNSNRVFHPHLCPDGSFNPNSVAGFPFSSSVETTRYAMPYSRNSNFSIFPSRRHMAPPTTILSNSIETLQALEQHQRFMDEYVTPYLPGGAHYPSIPYYERPEHPRNQQQSSMSIEDYLRDCGYRLQ